MSNLHRHLKLGAMSQGVGHRWGEWRRAQVQPVNRYAALQEEALA